MPATKNPNVETFKNVGQKTLNTIQELIKEGNVRKITITDKSGKTVAEFPLTFGVVGAVIAPILAAIGAIVALVNDCTISIEKRS